MLNKLIIVTFAFGTLATSIATASPLEDTSPIQQIQNELLIVSFKETGDICDEVFEDAETNRRIECVFG